VFGVAINISQSFFTSKQLHVPIYNMHFSHLLLAALASVASVEAGMIEPGTPDGVYIHQPDPVTGEVCILNKYRRIAY
jgi:hypothetical protein